MKVLIVSHNTIGPSTNLGITLASTFEAFDPAQLAQLYVRNELPTSGSCGSSYRITDKDAMKGVFTRRVAGREFQPAHLPPAPPQSLSQNALEKVRMLRRTPLMDMGRELYWALCPWKNKALRDWLQKVDPDVIFYAAGDYAFSFQIALYAARELNRPLVVACYDDFFFYVKNGKSLLGRLRHALYMRTVKKTMAYASGIVTICDAMARDYAEYFQKPCTVLYTPAPGKQTPPAGSGNTVAYFGTLGLGRDDQLAAIGRAVAATGAQTGIGHIDVYTWEKREEALAKMTPENGVLLHPAVSREEVRRILSHCAAVIHTESFDDVLRERVRYSISTKIPEALAYGPCLLAYGPAEAASIAYLEENRAAWVITRQEDLERGVLELLTDQAARQETVRRARQLARKNHDAAVNTQRLNRCFEAAIRGSRQRAQEEKKAGRQK